MLSLALAIMAKEKASNDLKAYDLGDYCGMCKYSFGNEVDKISTITGNISALNTNHESETDSNDEDYFSYSKSVSEILSFVFEYPFRQKNPMFGKKLRYFWFEQEPFSLCGKCAKIVAELYQIFWKFQKLVDETSPLSSIMGLWTNAIKRELLIECSDYFTNSNKPVIRNKGKSRTKNAKESSDSEYLHEFENANSDSSDSESRSSRRKSTRIRVLSKTSRATSHDVQEGIDSLNENGPEREEIERHSDVDYDDSLEHHDEISGEDEDTDTNYVLVHSKRDSSLKSKRGNANSTGMKHVCDACDRGFTRAWHLNRHRQAHCPKLPRSAKKIVCEVCLKSFTRSEHLKRHMELHDPSLGSSKSQRRPRQPAEKKVNVDRRSVEYHCPHCDKVYRSKNDLVIHIRKHTGETPFVCETCGKGFRSQNALSSHCITHDEECRFFCSICGKGFKRSISLKEHELLHKLGTERPFKCTTPDCGKSFRSKKHLLEHEKTHTTAGLQVCDLCGKSFSTKGSLHRHVRSVHENIPRLRAKPKAESRQQIKVESDEGNKFDNYESSGNNSI